MKKNKIIEIKKMMDLSGRCALVTGAAGGLGIVIATTLAELNADLILVDRPDKNLEKFCKKIQKKYDVEVYYKYCDLEIEDQRKKLIKDIINKQKYLNILVNNAAFVGTSDLEGWSTSFLEQSTQTWRRALEVNITAIFELCQGFAPLMMKSKGANIINIASIYGITAPDWSIYDGTKIGNPAAYAVSKGGLIQFTRWLSTAVAPKIRVNAISPGGIYRGQTNTFVERYNAKVPLKRMASENDLRGIITYLASDLSEYVTGQNISIDGGWSVW